MLFYLDKSGHFDDLKAEHAKNHTQVPVYEERKNKAYKEKHEFKRTARRRQFDEQASDYEYRKQILEKECRNAA